MELTIVDGADHMWRDATDPDAILAAAVGLLPPSPDPLSDNGSFPGHNRSLCPQWTERHNALS